MWVLPTLVCHERSFHRHRSGDPVVLTEAARHSRRAANAMADGRLRILSHLPPERLARVAREVADVEVVTIPAEGEIPADAHGEVLVTYTWGAPNIADAVARGVRWIHTIGTGVDRFPFDAIGDRVLTCARGASAVPIG